MTFPSLPPKPTITQTTNTPPPLPPKPTTKQTTNSPYPIPNKNTKGENVVKDSDGFYLSKLKKTTLKDVLEITPSSLHNFVLEYFNSSSITKRNQQSKIDTLMKGKYPYLQDHNIDPDAYTPTNMNAGCIVLNGITTEITGLAHPKKYNHSTNDVMDCLDECGITHLLALEKDQSKAVQSLANKKSINYSLLHVDDFISSGIEQEILDSAYAYVISIPKSAKLAIHCGEGQGRTGTVIASFIMRSIVEQADINHFTNEENTTIATVRSKTDRTPFMKTTPLTKLTVEMTRLCFNNASVETPMDIKSLHNLEQILRSLLSSSS